MTLRVVTISDKTVPGRHGFRYAVECRKNDSGWLSREDRYQLSEICRYCSKKYGRDYRPYYKRPGKKAKWLWQNANTFARVCFKSEHHLTIALLCVK